MIKIKILKGKYAGVERTLPSSAPDINALDLLVGLVREKEYWEIDWAQATEKEKLEWGRADMVARILRALREGRSVFFQGREYQATLEKIKDVAGEVEDAIASSGCMVSVESDDENGVRIGTRGPEYPLQ